MQAPAHPIPSCLLQGICAHLGVPFAGGCHSLQDPTAPRGRTRWPGGHQGLAPRFRMLQAQGPGVSNDCCSAWKEQHRKSSVGLPATKMLPSAPGGCQGTAGPVKAFTAPSPLASTSRQLLSSLQGPSWSLESALRASLLLQQCQRAPTRGPAPPPRPQARPHPLGQPDLARSALPSLPACGKVWKEGMEQGGNESKPLRPRLQSPRQQEPSEQFKYKMNCFNI